MPKFRNRDFTLKIIPHTPAGHTTPVSMAEQINMGIEL
jgi:hypothetical protein